MLPDCWLTPIGTATVLLEIGPIRILTDPAFDPAGGEYSFGFGTGSRKLQAPAITDPGPVDAVLLSHDQHADNLDRLGREYLPRAARVITTPSGFRRLRANSEPLPCWEKTELSRDGLRLRIQATPARHGPWWSRLIAGEVIGFRIEWEGQRHGALYISGDTVWHGRLRRVSSLGPIGAALLHLGGVRLPISGPVRYTFDATGAVEAVRALDPRTVVPIHYEGWSHFVEPKEAFAAAFARAGLADRIRWIAPGDRVRLEL